MEENNINVNIEKNSETVKEAIYSSGILMTCDMFYDFYTVIYHQLKK